MDLQFHYFAQMRFLLSFLAFCAACSALGFGLWFYGKGRGLGPDGSEVAISRGELQARATLKTTGAVLLATAAGLFVVFFLTLPKATVGGNGGIGAPGGWKIEQGPIRSDPGAQAPAAPE